MSPDEFKAACQLLFGDPHGWGIASAAEFLDISERNIKRFGAGERMVPPGVAEALYNEIGEQMAHVTRRSQPVFHVLREARMLADGV